MALLLLAGLPRAGAGVTPLTLHVWQAPYVGVVVHSGSSNPSGCNHTSALEGFNLTTGSVTGVTKLLGSSCNSASSTSGDVQTGEVGLALRHFTVAAGLHVITVNWTVNLKIALSIYGNACTSATAYAKVYVEAGWINLSGKGVSILGAVWPGVTHSITGANSGSWTVSKKLHLTWTAKLAPGASYSIYAIWHYHASAVVVNPTNPKYVCDASAYLTPASGSSIGTLTEITLA